MTGGGRGWQTRPGVPRGTSQRFGRNRWMMAMRRVRVAQANARWARRLGWGRHAVRIARALGGRSANPWSVRFADAIARWQRRSGFRATGVLAPREWLMLRRRLRIGVLPVASTGIVTPVALPTPMFPDPSMPDPSAAMEPPAAAMDGTGDGAEPPNEPAGEPEPSEPAADAAGSDGNGTPPEGEWYELVRWAAP